MTSNLLTQLAALAADSEAEPTPAQDFERPEATREQDAFAERLAEDFAQVEVRMLHDGVAAIIGREPLDANYDGRVNFLVAEDGHDLTTDEVIRRGYTEREWATARMESIDPSAPDALDRLRAIAAEVSRPYGQYDGRFDEATLARAAYGLSTKGGLSQVAGDLVLVMGRRDEFGTTVYSLRRCGFVSTPSGYLRAL